MQAWKTRSRETILKHSKYLTVESHTVELPDGTLIPDWAWLVTPDFVIVIAITDSGAFICFRQTKYAVDGETLAPVGGYLEPDEDPLAAAQRELLEETGYAAADWQSLGQYAVDGNRGAGTAHLFLAQSARQVAEPDADDLEEMELLRLSRDDVERALREGSFKVLPWTAAFALSLLHLKT
ncbi:MAG: NUDIX hydrolase [Anaerolineaceae bacterium]|nr:NUDIX hydrolase [Anaerolineaceae bacterium]